MAARRRVSTLITDGNSITNGHIPGGGTGTQAQDAWPVQFRRDATSTTRQWVVKSTAVSGATTTDRLAAYATDVRPLFGGGERILTFFEGFNDFTAGLTVSQVITLTRQYAEMALADGWYLLMLTPPGTTNTTVEPKLEQLRAWLRNSGYRVVDLAADARLADASNSTYWQTDGVHPKPAGYAVIADLVRARLSA